MLLALASGTLVLGSLFALWRTYRRTQASVRYLEGEDGQLPALQASDLEPARWVVVSAMRSLGAVVDAEARALAERERKPVEIEVAVDTELALWRRDCVAPGRMPGLARVVEDARRQVAAIWGQGEREICTVGELARKLDHLAQVLRESERRAIAESTPYRR